MADWIYSGSDAAVDAAGTKSLLYSHRAIWCSPPGLRPWPATPEPEDRLWLVWRAAAAPQTVLLLGGGRIAHAPRLVYGTNVLWTNTDDSGLRDAAMALGYRGPSSMSFLRLRRVLFPEGQPPVQGLAGIDSGLNIGTAKQVASLVGLLPIV